MNRVAVSLGISVAAGCRVECDHARVFREPVNRDVVVLVERLAATFATLR